MAFGLRLGPVGRRSSWKIGVSGRIQKPDGITNLQDRLVGVLSVEKVGSGLEPVVCIGKVTGMKDKFVLVDCSSQGTDRAVVQLRLDLRDRVSFGCSISVLAIDSKINHHAHVEGCCFSHRSRGQEVLHRGVGRVDLVVVDSAWLQSSENHSI